METYYSLAQNRFRDTFDINPGNIVKFVDSFKEGMTGTDWFLGNGCTWVRQMDQYLGEAWTIKMFEESGFIILDHNLRYTIAFLFPFGVIDTSKLSCPPMDKFLYNLSINYTEYNQLMQFIKQESNSPLT